MDIKQKAKNTVEKIKKNKHDLFFFCIFIGISIILLLNIIYVGFSISENTEKLRISISVIAIIEILYQVVSNKGKYKLIQNKLDILLIFFVISTTISLVFKTYVSLYDEMNNILRYVSAFSLYVIVRDLCRYDKKYKKRILNIIVVAGIGTAIIGIDDLTTKFLTNILQNAGVVFDVNIEQRMLGAFSYANAFAIAIAIAVFIAIGNYLNEENVKVKKIYPVVIFILSGALVLSYSRMVLILTSIFLIFFFFLLKEKRKKIEYLKLIIFIGIGVIVYSKIFSYVLAINDYWLLWGITLLEAMILFFTINYTTKIDEFLCKASMKKIIFVVAILSMGFVLFIIIGLNLTVPLHLFENKDSELVYEYRIRKVEPNTVLNMKFDIEAITNLKNNFILKIMEQDAAYNTIKIDEYLFGNFKGIKEINFETSDQAYLIVIQVVNKNREKNQSFTINELRINDELIPLKYKYLPIELVDKIKGISITDINLYNRKIFIQDAIKLIEKNPIFGYGGEAFDYLQSEVQDCYYVVAEVHSHPIQLVLENGIFSVLIYVGIIIYYIIYIIRKKYKDTLDLGVIFALGILIVHSSLDFDMSFMYLLFDFFLLLALITPNKTKENTNKIVNNVIIAILTIMLIVNIYGNLKLNTYEPLNVFDKIYIENDTNEELIGELLKYRKNEKYTAYYNATSSLLFLIENEVKNGNFRYLEDLYEIIEERYAPLDTEWNLEKINKTKDIVDAYKQKNDGATLDEYEKTIEEIIKYIKNETLELEKLWKDNTVIRKTKAETTMIMEELNNIRNSL